MPCSGTAILRAELVPVTEVPKARQGPGRPERSPAGRPETNAKNDRNALRLEPSGPETAGPATAGMSQQ